MERYTPKQMRLLTACLVAYVAAYISRTNLSPALGAIQLEFGLTAAQVGLLPTLFAIPYSIGQIVSGTMADRFRARNCILIGLLGSALINIAFACSPSYDIMMALWCVNGCFQSMIWTPMVPLIARNFQDSLRARAMFLLSMTLIIGYLCAWLLSGLLTSHFSWRVAFYASGAVTAVLAIGSFFALDDGSGAPSRSSREKQTADTARAPIGKLLLGTDLLFILLCCIFNGYVRDSIMNWAPKMLVDTQGIDLSNALGVVLIIPIINYLGIQFGKRTYLRLDSNVRRTIQVMMLLCSAFSLILTLFYHVNAIFCALLLALCSAMAYSLNPLLTSIIPMDFRDSGRMALVAGMIDAMIYVGSAFSGTFAGFLKDSLGWSAVFASWLFFSLLGMFMIALAIRKTRTQK